MPRNNNGIQKERHGVRILPPRVILPLFGLHKYTYCNITIYHQACFFHFFSSLSSSWHFVLFCITFQFLKGFTKMSGSNLETRSLLDELKNIEKKFFFDLGHPLLNRIAETFITSAGVISSSFSSLFI